MILPRLSHLAPPLRLLPLLTLALVLGACSGGEEAKGKPAAASKPPVPVSVAVAVEKAVPVELRAVGEVESIARVTVRSQVAGVIALVHFREGTEVRAGDLLFTIDPKPLQAALARAEAELERNRVEAETARREAARFADLLTSGFVSRDEAEAVQGRSDSLQAALAARCRRSWASWRSGILKPTLIGARFWMLTRSGPSLARTTVPGWTSSAPVRPDWGARMAL